MSKRRRGLWPYAPAWHSFLTPDKRPNFITLYALARQISQCLVLILGARIGRLNQQFDHTVNRNINQAGRGSDAASIHQTAKNLNSFFGVQFVHGDRMLARVSKVK
jgi:hypothetical protein